MLELYIPKPEDLWFVRQMQEDPATMSYNANWDVSYEGYHRDTGCVDFPESDWADWYAQWVNPGSDRCFFAYLRRSGDGAWIGNVCFHYTPEEDWWDMGIVIFAPYRGLGYAVPGLKLLTNQAFQVWGINRLHNDFELARNEQSAWRAHFSAGFREISRENGWLTVMLTREQWLQDHT